MSLNPNTVIWLTDTYGVALDEYQGSFKLQGVNKYQKDNKDMVTWDWQYKSIWNKETRKRELPAKANSVAGITLGDRDQAIASLQSILRELGWQSSDPAPPGPVDDDQIPF